MGRKEVKKESGALRYCFGRMNVRGAWSTVCKLEDLFMSDTCSVTD